MKKLVFKTLFLFLVFLVQLVQLVHAQQKRTYTFKNYSNKEGFDQNTVWAIEQDKYGMLWIGSANGLIRYDGYSFQNVSWNQDSQSDIYHGRVRDIYSDKKGLIWIISENGLSIYNPSNDLFIKIPSVSKVDINGIIEDQDGVVWACGAGYLANVTSEITSDSIIVNWSQNLWPKEYSDIRINDLLKVSDDLILLATSKGVCKMTTNEDKLSSFEYDPILEVGNVRKLLRHKSIIWIGTESGLLKTVMDGKKIRYLNKYNHDISDAGSLAGDDVRDLLIGPDNKLWIATWGNGLSEYDIDSEVFTNFAYDPRSENGIGSNKINCIHKDQFNVLWIGTGQGGLSKLNLDGKQFINIKNNPYDNQTISGNLISAIYEDSEGFLWVSAVENALCRSSERINENNVANLKFKRFDDWYRKYPDKTIRSIFEDQRGLIWLGYENSVVIYNRAKNTFSKVEFRKNGQLLNVINISSINSFNGDKLIIGGNYIAILNISKQNFQTNSENKIVVQVEYCQRIEGNATTVNSDGKDKIWVGHRNFGLSQYGLSGDSLYLVKNYKSSDTNPNSISNNSVFVIHQDIEQNLWIGTFGGGLNKVINKTDDTELQFTQVKFDQNDNVVYGIIEENDSILWFSTDFGICKLNKQNNKTLRFNMSDGIASNNFRKDAFHKGRSGIYYFGGVYGLTLFEPESIKNNLIPPEVKLSGLRINNKKINPGEQVSEKFILEKSIFETAEIVLTPNDRTLSVDVVVMHTATPEKNSFSYILEGFDEEWVGVDRGNQTLNYTNLPSGKYKLRIRGFNCDGIQSVGETSLSIVMLAPWYEQLWSRILFVLFSFSLIIGVSFYFIKLKNLQNSLHFEQLDKERITEVNKAKLRFFTDVSHEFRTPLSLISIPLQKLKEINTDKKQEPFINVIDKNTNKLIRLIDQLLAFRKIEYGKLDLKYRMTTIDDFLYPIYQAFELFAEKKQIEFQFSVKNNNPAFAIDLEKMEQVLYNLLSNSFKATPSNGRISLEGSSFEIDGKPYIGFNIKDTGKGIQQKDIHKIFERFYQSDSQLTNMGTGIGLSYSKSIVELHNGTIEVQSIPNQETIFSIKIPLIECSSNVDEIVELKRINTLDVVKFDEWSTFEDSSEKDNEKKESTMLVVDDEEDFRTAIRELFKHDFRILEAENGKDALALTKEEVPDVIISDVMMPEMNGYDFCKEVKTDLDLCHIPVILLTALEDMDNQIQGLEYGADAYIFKPFNLKHLEVNVKKLILNRLKLKEHFTRNHSIPKDIRISNIDKDFIEKINDEIKDNLNDSSFGVEQLAQNINLGTSQLYRKLKQLTGQVPNEYIRSFRLQVAADALSANPGISVKNVMYEVGFESASHFSHAFKKKFGVNPTVYIKNLSK